MRISHIPSPPTHVAFNMFPPCVKPILSCFFFFSLSLSFFHRDVRRLVVAMSRARLGLYIFARVSLFENCFELTPAFKQLTARPLQLHIRPHEYYSQEQPVRRSTCMFWSLDKLYSHNPFTFPIVSLINTLRSMLVLSSFLFHLVFTGLEFFCYFIHTVNISVKGSLSMGNTSLAIFNPQRSKNKTPGPDQHDMAVVWSLHLTGWCSVVTGQSKIPQSLWHFLWLSSVHPHEGQLFWVHTCGPCLACPSTVGKSLLLTRTCRFCLTPPPPEGSKAI